jgi:hypothetical protein
MERPSHLLSSFDVATGEKLAEIALIKPGIVPNLNPRSSPQ